MTTRPDNPSRRQRHDRVIGVVAPAPADIKAYQGDAPPVR